MKLRWYLSLLWISGCALLTLLDINICSLHKKWSFPLRISSVNVTESAFLRICAHLLKKSLIKNFIFSAVSFRNLFEPENSNAGKDNFLKQKMEITFFRQITDNLTLHSLAFLFNTWLPISVLKRVFDKICYKYATVSLLQSYEIFRSCLIFKCYICDAGSTNYLIIFKSIFCECKHFLVIKQYPIYAKKFF